MALVIKSVGQIPALISAPSAIVMVSVDWSPGPLKTREVLIALESSREIWSPDSSVEFFELHPEHDEQLNQWYERMCDCYAPQFELHGHGYGPLWWVAHGLVLDCMTKPYERPLPVLQDLSTALLRNVKDGDL